MTKVHPRALVAAVLIVVSAAVAQLMIPRELMARASDVYNLEDIVPKQFGDWTLVPEVGVVEPDEPDSLAHEIYTQVLTRGYSDRAGHIVMLLLAYGPSQSDRLQLHRPEVCYVAQGFRVFNATTAELANPAGPALKLRRMVAQKGPRLEPITYWMRVGDDIASGVLERQVIKLKYGLRGIVPDGLLARVSTTGISEASSFRIQDEFIRDLIGAVGPAHLKFFVGDLSWSRGRQARAATRTETGAASD